MQYLKALRFYTAWLNFQINAIFSIFRENIFDLARKIQLQISILKQLVIYRALYARILMKLKFIQVLILFK